MTEFEAYKQFLGLKLHFTTDNYDVFRYKGVVKYLTEHSYEHSDNKDKKRLFKNLAKEKDSVSLIEYYVANFCEGKEWISYFEDRIWREWKIRNQRIEYHFINDAEKLLTLEPEFDIIFKCDKGNHPKLLKSYLSKKITLETLVILERLLRYRKRFDKEIIETYVWPNISRRIRKADPFIEADIVKCKQMLMEKVTELRNE